VRYRTDRTLAAILRNDLEPKTLLSGSSLRHGPRNGRFGHKLEWAVEIGRTLVFRPVASEQDEKLSTFVVKVSDPPELNASFGLVAPPWQDYEDRYPQLCGVFGRLHFCSIPPRRPTRPRIVVDKTVVGQLIRLMPTSM
jgi:hypothetical protein